MSMIEKKKLDREMGELNEDEQVVHEKNATTTVTMMMRKGKMKEKTKRSSKMRLLRMEKIGRACSKDTMKRLCGQCRRGDE